MLSGLVSKTSASGQYDLFKDALDREHVRSEALMKVMDSINRRFAGGISLAAAGVQKNWQHNVCHLSKRYMTCWDELAVVRC